jgi:hypothetical protein
MDESDGNSRNPIDWAKKLLTLGVGAVFLTEESIRGFAQDFKLPKEVLAAVLENAGKVRSDFIQNFSSELISKISGRFDPHLFMGEFFRKNEVTLEIKIKVKETHKAPGTEVSKK